MTSSLHLQSQPNVPERGGFALLYAVFGTFVVATMVSLTFTLAGASATRAATTKSTARGRLLVAGG